MKIEHISQVKELSDKLISLRKIATAKNVSIVQVTVVNHDSEVILQRKKQTEDFWIKPSKTNWDQLIRSEIADIEYKLRELGVEV
jgi:hypothetical protein